MVATPHNFTVVSGRDKRIRLPRVVEDDVAVDLTGAVVRWGAQTTGALVGAADTISLSSEDGGIEILDQTDQALRGYAELLFTPEMTAPFDDVVLDHEAIAIDIAGTTHHVSFGTCTVLADVVD